MNKDYQVVLPSLNGILSHETMAYDGLKRPIEISRIFDRLVLNSSDSSLVMDDLERQKVMEDYFHDLYGVLMKRLSQFAVESDPSEDDALKLLAMMQEFLKVKKTLIKNAS